ncbi:MAG: hypothetical protein ABI690_32630 [Chloroflexota bacterium]
MIPDFNANTVLLRLNCTFYDINDDKDEHANREFFSNFAIFIIGIRRFERVASHSDENEWRKSFSRREKQKVSNKILGVDFPRFIIEQKFSICQFENG